MHHVRTFNYGLTPNVNTSKLSKKQKIKNKSGIINQTKKNAIKQKHLIKH